VGSGEIESPVKVTLRPVPLGRRNTSGHALVLLVAIQAIDPINGALIVPLGRPARCDESAASPVHILDPGSRQWRYKAPSASLLVVARGVRIDAGHSLVRKGQCAYGQDQRRDRDGRHAKGRL
jgi:hypothetical protein